MSQFGKYYLLGGAALIAGIYWFSHSNHQNLVSKASPQAIKAPLHPATTAIAVTQNSSPNLNPNANSTTTPSSPFSARLERHVKYVAMMLARPDVALPPQATKADHLTSEEIQQLGQAAVDTKQTHTIRRASVYLLSKAGAKAIPALGTIVTTNFKNREQDTEAPLRITALESLDRLTDNSKEVLPILEKTILAQENKSLAFLASISASGIRQGKPGKLSRAMNMMIQEKMAYKDNGQ